jgi:ABC-2 type transport system ATP-binding protein
VSSVSLLAPSSTRTRAAAPGGRWMDEADRLADWIAVLDRGRLVAEGTSGELKRLVPGGHVRLQLADGAELERAARALGEVSRDDDQLVLRVPSDGGVRSLRALLDRLDDEGIEAEGLSVHTPDLDDVFLALTGRPQEAGRPAERSEVLR